LCQVNLVSLGATFPKISFPVWLEVRVSKGGTWVRFGRQK
jgi:hypothetical protein